MKSKTLMRYFGERFQVWVTRCPSAEAVPVSMIYGETVQDLKNKIGLRPVDEIVMRSRVLPNDEMIHVKDTAVMVVVQKQICSDYNQTNDFH
jgi:hypothetical protein